MKSMCATNVLSVNYINSTLLCNQFFFFFYLGSQVFLTYCLIPVSEIHCLIYLSMIPRKNNINMKPCETQHIDRHFCLDLSAVAFYESFLNDMIFLSLFLSYPPISKPNSAAVFAQSNQQANQQMQDITSPLLADKIKPIISIYQSCVAKWAWIIVSRMTLCLVMSVCK